MKLFLNFAKYSTFLLAVYTVYQLRRFVQVNNNEDPVKRQLSQAIMEKACEDTDTGSLDADMAQQVYDSLHALRGDNQLLKPMHTNTGWDDYFVSFVGIILAFGILSLIELLMFIGCCFQCSCQKCCTCCKRDYQVNPYNQIVSNFCIIGSFVLFLGILSSAIAGLVFTKNLSVRFNRVQCTMYMAFQDFLEGNPSRQWVGINQIQPTWQNTKNTLLNNFKDMQKYFDTNNMNLLNTTSNDIKNKILQIETDFSTMQVTGPNPSIPSGQIKIDYIKNFFPNTTNKFLQGLWIEYYAKNQGYKQALSSLQSIVYTFDLNKAVQQVDSAISSSLGTITSSVPTDSDISNIIDQGDNSQFYVNLALYLLFSFFLAISVFSIVSIVAVGKFKQKIYLYVIYVSWAIGSIVIVFLFLICSVLLVVSIFSLEMCELMSLVLSTPEAFQEYTEILGSSSTKKYTLPCFFGGTNPLINDFNSSLQNVNQMYNDLTLLDQRRKESQNSAGTYYYTEDLIKLLNQTLNNPKNASIQETGDSNSQSVFNYLNSLTNYQFSGSVQSSACSPTVSQERLVYNETECLDYGTPLTVADASTPIDKNVKKCILISSDFQNSYFGHIGSSYDSCSQQQSKAYPQLIKDYYAQLATFKTSVTTNLLSMRTVLNEKLIQDQAFYTIFDNINANVSQGFSTCKQSIDQISDPQTGIINQLQCTVFGDRIREFQNNFCNGYFIKIYQLTCVIIVCTCFGFVGNVLLFFSTSRLRSMAEGGADKKQQLLPNDDKSFQQFNFQQVELSSQVMNGKKMYERYEQKTPH